MIVVGIALLAHGVRGLLLVYGGNEIFATVSHIEITPATPSLPEQRRVFVVYEVDGAVYQGGLGSHSDLHIGEQVRIRYNPNNPGGLIVRGDHFLSPAWIPVMIGLVVLFVLFFNWWKKRELDIDF